MASGTNKMPSAVKFLWLLLVQMSLCIPFAIWKGGAFTAVSEKFCKTAVVAMLISMAVVSVTELRKLLWIQVSAVNLVVFFSILLHHTRDGRLEGIQKGVLENPNDLAINIAISFPIGLAFLLRARGFKKVVWAIGLGVMAVGIVLTYSRSGLLAFILSLTVCVWEYGIKGNRRYIIWTTAVLLVGGLGVSLSSSHYRARVESILAGNVEGSGDKGSLEARKALLKKSIMVAATHPLFGVGPGCFILVDKGWVVAHNTYTELAAEAGFPAILLFLLALGAALKNIAYVKASAKYYDDPEIRLFTQALWAGLVAYIMAACFASTEYNLYPYFLIGYTCAMVRIVGPTRADKSTLKEESKRKRATYDRFARPQPTWVG
jgi:O-antigen ligase